MNKLIRIHPSYYGLILFLFIVLLFVAFANLGRDFKFLREGAFCLFPVLMVLGILGIVKAKRWFQYGVSALCILIAAPISYGLKNVVFFGYPPTDSIFSLIDNENTVWAAGYSKEKFSLVKEGMSEDEVLEILGEPLVVENRKSGVNWFYTSGPRGNVQGRVRGSTHIRRILFDSEGVSLKESSYYID